MTEKLASRIAGLKLGGIVAILMIPMLVLSFLMVTNLHQDIAFAEREKLGANMVELLNLTSTPLSRLPAEKLRPSRESLEAIVASM